MPMRWLGVVLIVLGGLALGFQGWTYGLEHKPGWVEFLWQTLALGERPWLFPVAGGGLVAAGLLVLAGGADWARLNS